jgi:hypothetical protein
VGESDGYGPRGKGDIVLYHWSFAIFFATLAAIPWLPWLSYRFSLRTLLIATTLIAVLLGFAVWAMR